MRGSALAAQRAGAAALKRHCSVDQGHHDPAREQRGGISLKEVAVDDRQIGAKARLEHAQAIFGERCVGRTRGEAAERLFERELLLGMPAALWFSVGLLPGDSRVDSPERVDDFDGEVAAVGERNARLERTIARRRRRRPDPGPSRASAQRRSSLACEGCIEAITPSSAKRATSCFRTTWACSIRSRGSRASGTAFRAAA